MNTNIALFVCCIFCFIPRYNAFVAPVEKGWPFTKTLAEQLIQKRKADILKEKFSIPTYDEMINYERKTKIDADEFYRKSISPKIFNGEESHPSEFQFMVSIKWPFDDGYLGGHYCGGTLIAENVVLTAAHCILYEPVEVTVKGDTEHYDGSETFQTIGPGVVHPYYQFTGLDFDVAVLYLDGKSTIEPIELSKIIYHEDTADDTVVTGWGLTETGVFPEHLMEVDVDLMSNEDCNDNTDYNGLITDSMLCAGKPKEGKDACFGDSGGPLLIYEDDVWKQIGIVSFGGEVCAEAMAPGVYSRISHSYNWIMDQLDETLTPAPTPFYGNGTAPTASPTVYPTPSSDLYGYYFMKQYHAEYAPNVYVTKEMYHDSDCTIPLGASDNTIFKMVHEQHVCEIQSAIQYSSGTVSSIDGFSKYISCGDGFCSAMYFNGMSCREEFVEVVDEGPEGECITDWNWNQYTKLKHETSIPYGQAKFDVGLFDEALGVATFVQAYIMSTEECTTIDGFAYTAVCDTNGIGTIFMHDDGCESERFPAIIPMDSDELSGEAAVVLRCTNGL